MRIQPVLSEAEVEAIDKMAAITRTKKTEVIKNALAVYQWFLRQAISGAQVVARKPTGEETVLETPELGVVQGRSQRLNPRELGLLGRKLETAKSPEEAARLRERIARGFYGV